MKQLGDFPMDETKAHLHSPRYKPPTSGNPKAKEQRLADALRENLRKRKDQMRLRKEEQGTSSNREE